MFYKLSIAIWNLMLSLIGVGIKMTPDGFSPDAWSYVRNTVYPWMGAAGASLLNIFFLVGMLRQINNLREGLTLERFIEIGIKAVLANAILLIGFDLMEQMFSISGYMGNIVMSGTEISYTAADLDIGTVLFEIVFGIVFFLVSIICSGTVFLVVYGRYLQIYLLAATYPVALSTLPGGAGIAQTGYAWFKTFLAKVFSIVVIALIIVIVSKMSLSDDSFYGLGAALSGEFGAIDGLPQALVNMCNMVLLSASVKGADTFMRRTFAL